jgi:hypothetical protein
MSDLPENLVPAQRDDLIAKLAFALTRDRRLARMQSAELPASIVAERIVERLEASGYVVMRGAGAGRGSARPRSSAPMMLRWLRRRQDARIRSGSATKSTLTLDSWARLIYLVISYVSMVGAQGFEPWTR